MKLRRYHIDFCHDYLKTGNPSESYPKFFKAKNVQVAAAGSSRLMARPEIKEYITKIKQEEEQILRQARAEQLEKMKDEIITEIELDKFHTDVLRNTITVEEIVIMREFTPARMEGKKQIPGRWASSIKKIQRAPNLREKQISAEQLFKRKGSFAQIKLKVDGEVLLNDNNNVKRMIKLSTGEQIPVPE